MATEASLPTKTGYTERKQANSTLGRKRARDDDAEAPHRDVKKSRIKTDRDTKAGPDTISPPVDSLLSPLVEAMDHGSDTPSKNKRKESKHRDTNGITIEHTEIALNEKAEGIDEAAEHPRNELKKKKKRKSEGEMKEEKKKKKKKKKEKQKIMYGDANGTALEEHAGVDLDGKTEHPLEEHKRKKKMKSEAELKEKKKKRKSKHNDDAYDNTLEAHAGIDVELMAKGVDETTKRPRKEHKKKKERKGEKKERESKLSRHRDGTEVELGIKRKGLDKSGIPESPLQFTKSAVPPPEPETPRPHPSVHQPPHAPAQPEFPFFTQTVSLCLPVYPNGWASPIAAVSSQHLDPLINRYVPHLGGVLLAYHSVTLSDTPGRRGAARSDSEPAGLVSVNEYAVGFGWVTADVDLFIPTRGAWMEGSINLQNEGHLGVVCWSKFNASIESRRLPAHWHWVHSETDEAAMYDDGVADISSHADPHGLVQQMYSTGFWADGFGKKVGGRLRFRIRNFDVGIAGEHGYLSIEGTMLDDDAERTLQGELGNELSGRRVLPEFGTTKFGVTDENEAGTTLRGQRPGGEKDWW